MNIEIHLPSSAPLSRSLKLRIKKAGGRYSECRGNHFTRYVVVPEGMANEVCFTAIDEYRTAPKLTLIARDFPSAAYEDRLPSWCVVHYWTPKEGNADAWLRAKAEKCKKQYDWTQAKGREVEATMLEKYPNIF